MDGLPAPRTAGASHHGCGGCMVPTNRPGWLICLRCQHAEPVAPDPQTALTAEERQQLTAWKWRYQATADYGFDLTTAKRLTFSRYLYERGRLVG